MSYRDNIFGQLFDPETRLAMHQAGLTGVRHLNQRFPLDVEPHQPVEVLVTTSGPRPFDQVTCWFQPEGETELALELSQGKVTWDNALGDYLRTWQGNLPPQPSGTMVQYRLAAHVTGSNEWIYADNQSASADECTRFAYWVADDLVPAWTREAVVYHVFVDRFYPGEGVSWKNPETLAGFYGGTLRGIIQKLDYIQQMGFTAVWLSPIFPNLTHHGYDATDYFGIEPRFGTMEDFRELLTDAHARGIRVILDFVANHCSDQHPAFQSAKTDPNSPTRDWFTWQHWPEDYACYFGVRELPELNLKPGPARNYLLKSAQFWLEMGVDGFRLDYAYGPSHDFWADFRRTCRQAKPDCWTFGEIIHTPEVQLSYAGTMDGTLDFLLCRAVRETFAHGNWPLSRFESFLNEHDAFFPAGFSRPAFLDNHDMNRFLFISNGDTAKVKLAALALFTLSGPQIVYNGTETGVSQERPIHQNDFGIFEEARLPMKWGDDQDTDLREYFRRIIQLRHENHLLLDSPRRLLHIGDQVLAYSRESRSTRIVVAFNLSDQPQTISVPLTKHMVDVLNNCKVSADGNNFLINLPPQTGAFLTDLS
jgi:glycosidase